MSKQGASQLMMRTVGCVLLVLLNQLEPVQLDEMLLAPPPSSHIVDLSEPGNLDSEASIGEPVNDAAVGKYWSKAQINLSVFQSVGTRHATTEDRFDIQRDSLGNSYFAVFDGHGGDITSSLMKKEAIKNYIAPVIRAFSNELNDNKLTLDYDLLKRNLKDAVMKLDAQALGLAKDGSTFNMVVDTSEYVISINVGDSRSVVRDPFAQTFALSEDHKPNSPYERERIVRSGSHVTRQKGRSIYVSRVNLLAMSRSIGDAICKKKPGVVISEPDVLIYAKNNDKKYYNYATMIVLATDGLWDVFSNEKVTDSIFKTYCKKDLISRFIDDQSQLLSKSLEELGREARRGTNDDITIVAAILDKRMCKYRQD